MPYIWRHVTIKATPRVKAFANQAMLLQDACNGRAVARTLTSVMDYFCSDECRDSGQEFIGTDLANQNPITCVILNKMMDLTRYMRGKQQWESHPDAHSIDLYDAINSLIGGTDITWPIQCQEYSTAVSVCKNCHQDIHCEVHNGTEVWVDEWTGGDVCGVNCSDGNNEPHIPTLH